MVSCDSHVMSCDARFWLSEQLCFSHPDPWNERGKSISEVSIVTEDMARKQRGDGRTLHGCIEHQDQDADIFSLKPLRKSAYLPNSILPSILPG